MLNKMKYIPTSLFLVIFCSKALPAYYPSDGDLYYNGYYFADSYFTWSSPGPWQNENPGYEHDLWLHESGYFTSSCTSWTNLPAPYNDCPTAGLLDPNGPVFSFGTYDADAVEADEYYYGYWGWSSHDPEVTTTPINLQGQENRNVCGGIKIIWCMGSVRTQNLIWGINMNWGGIPTLFFF